MPLEIVFLMPQDWSRQTPYQYSTITAVKGVHLNLLINEDVRLILYVSSFEASFLAWCLLLRPKLRGTSCESSEGVRLPRDMGQTFVGGPASQRHGADLCGGSGELPTKSGELTGKSVKLPGKLGIVLKVRSEAPKGDI